MSTECVKVMVRCRPMNSKEKQGGSKMCVSVDASINQVVLKKLSDSSEIPKAFTYDAVYDWSST